MLHTEIKNCRMGQGSTVKPRRRLKRKYVPAKPTYMTDGLPISSYKVSISEKNYGYSGSAYYATRIESTE